MNHTLHHILSGLKTDVETLVSADFDVVDPRFIHHIYEAMAILKMARKTVPVHLWQDCLHHCEPTRYSKIAQYLEAYLGGRYKAELAIRRMRPLEEKKAELRRYVQISRQSALTSVPQITVPDNQKVSA